MRIPNLMKHCAFCVFVICKPNCAAWFVTGLSPLTPFYKSVLICRSTVSICPADLLMKTDLKLGSFQLCIRPVFVTKGFHTGSHLLSISSFHSTKVCTFPSPTPSSLSDSMHRQLAHFWAMSETWWHRYTSVAGLVLNMNKNHFRPVTSLVYLGLQMNVPRQTLMPTPAILNISGTLWWLLLMLQHRVCVISLTTLCG